MNRLKNVVNERRYSKMRAALVSMVYLGDDIGAGALLVALTMGLAIVVTHIQ